MKQKDIALILVVIVVAGAFSFGVSGTVFKTKKRDLTAEVVTKIDANFADPDPAVFNDKAINPTQLINIGDNSTNPQPF